jgi:large subunit ribosomal protein L16
LWVAMILPGRIVFEMNGVTREQAQAAFRLASAKLPFKTRFVSRD